MRFFIIFASFFAATLSVQRFFIAKAFSSNTSKLEKLYQTQTPPTPAHAEGLSAELLRLEALLEQLQTQTSSTQILSDKIQALGPVALKKIDTLNEALFLKPVEAKLIELNLPSALLAHLLKLLTQAHYLPMSMRLEARPNNTVNASLKIAQTFQEMPKILTETPSKVSSSHKTMSDSITSLSKSTFDEAIKTGVVLVDFWAPWCGPCRAIAPVLDEVAQAMGKKASICKVLVDENQEIAARYGVQSIPTLIIFKDGQELERIVGLNSKDSIVALLNKALAQ